MALLLPARLVVEITAVSVRNRRAISINTFVEDREMRSKSILVLAMLSLSGFTTLAPTSAFGSLFHKIIDPVLKE